MIQSITRLSLLHYGESRIMVTAKVVGRILKMNVQYQVLCTSSI